MQRFVRVCAARSRTFFFKRKGECRVHSSSTHEEISQIPAKPNFSANRGQNSLNPRHDALRRAIAIMTSALVDFAVTHTHLNGIQGFSEIVQVQVLKLCCRQRESLAYVRDCLFLEPVRWLGQSHRIAHQLSLHLLLGAT